MKPVLQIILVGSFLCRSFQVQASEETSELTFVPEEIAKKEVLSVEDNSSVVSAGIRDEPEIEDVKKMISDYEKSVIEYRNLIRLVATQKYKIRKNEINKRYDARLKPVLTKERVFRLEAIQVFEKFVKAHPKNKKYTPDAIFRLAELYFEKYDDEFQVQLATFRDNFAKWNDAGGEGDPPEEPQRDFTRTIQLYRTLAQRFPDYRLMDAVYYLLGYTLKSQGDEEEGMAEWKNLVQKFPKSRFYAEVWFRIGDFHFDAESWPEAISAFSHVVTEKESNYYDKSLYKLAWTYYLVNEFDKSVALFFELLDYSFAEKEKTGEKTGSVLEEEAVQYVAISFSDDTWEHENKYKKLIAGEDFNDEFAEFDIDYVKFALDFFEKIESQAGKTKPYKREVIAKLGEILFKQSKNMQAIKALEVAIRIDEMHIDSPKLQDMIVQAWEREREFESASKARDVMVQKFGASSEWAKAHKNEVKEIRKAEELARISLYKAAIYYHQQAQKYFDDGKEKLSVEFFQAASKAYGEYLTLYPHDKEAYELSYYLADTYYYAHDFENASKSYQAVRESTLGSKYRADAAVNIVYSIEKLIDLGIKNETVEDRDIFQPPAPSEDGVAKVKEAIPEVRKKYIEAVDGLYKVSPKHEKSPAFRYAAAAIYYSYGHLDEAVKRFEDIVASYPNHEAAKFAANFILDYWLGKKDWQKAASYAAKFKNTLSDDSGTFAKIEGGAKFQIAKKMLEDGEKALKAGDIAEGLSMLEKGAEEYLLLLEDDPKRDFADIMLYNAALSLEKAKRPSKAAGLYERLYKEYPESSFAPEAMFRVGTKKEQIFDFDGAIETYLELVTKYKESDRRVDAQINAALALEGQQKYEKAAKEFERFAKLFPKNPETTKVFFRASNVYKKMGSEKKELGSLKRFIKRYGKISEEKALLIEAYSRIGEIYAQQAQKSKKWKSRKALLKKSKVALNNALKGYARSEKGMSESYFAGKSAFLLAEEEFAKYKKMKMAANSGKKQAKELIAKAKKLQEVQNIYKTVIGTYKQAEWSLAGLYRIGSLYDELQKSIFDAPCPADIRRIDEIACDEYKAVLEDKAYSIEAKAIEAYRVGYEKARELKIVNKWTKRTLEALNLLASAEFPINKAPIFSPSKKKIHFLGAVLPDGGSQVLKEMQNRARADSVKNHQDVDNANELEAKEGDVSSVKTADEQDKGVTDAQ